MSIRQGVTQTTHDIIIISIDTDEGVLEPFGVGDATLGSLLETAGTSKGSRPSPFNL